MTDASNLTGSEFKRRIFEHGGRGRQNLLRGVVTEIGNSAIRPPSSLGSGQTATIDFEVGKYRTPMA